MNRSHIRAGLGATALLPGHALAQADAIGSTGSAVASSTSFIGEAAAYFAAEEPYFMELAKEFSLDPKVVYFMAAQNGSMLRAVLSRMKEGLDKIAAGPLPA